jgi:hypothetical protein
MSFANKLTSSLTWWLSKKPFIINDEYQLELLYIDRINNSAKIKITNLKTGEVTEQPVPETEFQDGNQ